MQKRAHLPQSQGKPLGRPFEIGSLGVLRLLRNEDPPGWSRHFRREASWRFLGCSPRPRSHGMLPLPAQRQSGLLMTNYRDLADGLDWYLASASAFLDPWNYPAPSLPFDG